MTSDQTFDLHFLLSLCLSTCSQSQALKERPGGLTRGVTGFRLGDGGDADSQSRFYGVTVSTEDFKSFSRGSIPRRTYFFTF